jgi:hypothetical protein
MQELDVSMAYFRRTDMFYASTLWMSQCRYLTNSVSENTSTGYRLLQPGLSTIKTGVRVPIRRITSGLF